MAASVLTSMSSWGETDVVLHSVSPALVSSVSTIRAIESVNVHDVCLVGSTVSKTWHSSITPDWISRLFMVGLNTAHEILWITTQQGIRTLVHPITWRYQVNHLNLHRN